MSGLQEMDNQSTLDLLPGRESFHAEVLSGLRKAQKELPSKYIYDEKGARLFEDICALDEYYIPRTEEAIMKSCMGEIAELLGPRVRLVEYGSGNCSKAQNLLKNLHEPAAYIPIDISREQLLCAAGEINSCYPAIEVLPVCADYLTDFNLPLPRGEFRRTVVFFPGSTISNFDPGPARLFLERTARACGPGGALLIGVDLKKDATILHKAYDDSQGVTAAFNLNLLERINNELGADFNLDYFSHQVVYNACEGRIEMHLVSLRKQIVNVDGAAVQFSEGETIWTESSYKYTLEEFAMMALDTGFNVERVWTDEKQWFSVQYLVAV